MALEVVDAMITILSHFEYASVTTRKVCPWNGPVKSMCIRDQGALGVSHSHAGALGGAGHDSWHCLHLETH